MVNCLTFRRVGFGQSTSAGGCSMIVGTYAGAVHTRPVRSKMAGTANERAPHRAPFPAASVQAVAAWSARQSVTASSSARASSPASSGGSHRAPVTRASGPTAIAC